MTVKTDDNLIGVERYSKSTKLVNPFSPLPLSLLSHHFSTTDSYLSSVDFHLIHDGRPGLVHRPTSTCNTHRGYVIGNVSIKRVKSVVLHNKKQKGITNSFTILLTDQNTFVSDREFSVTQTFSLYLPSVTVCFLSLWCLTKEQPTCRISLHFN